MAAAQGGKGAVCPHATNKSHCQGKDPSTRLLPWLSKRDPAFCTLYFLPSPEQDLGHRRQSELFFAFLANIYPLHFPSARQLPGERSWCSAQARKTERCIPPMQQRCRAEPSALAGWRGPGEHAPTSAPTHRPQAAHANGEEEDCSPHFGPLLQDFRSNVFFRSLLPSGDAKPRQRGEPF